MPGRKLKRRSQGQGSEALPDRDQLLALIEDRGTADKRDLMRELGVKGRDRTALKRMLRDLEDEGALPDAPPAPRRRDDGGLPPVGVLEVTGIAADGELLARPVNVAEGAASPAIVVASERGRAPGVGDRILARLSRRGEGYEAHVMRVLPAQPARFVGQLERARDGLRVRPAGSRGAGELRVRPADSLGAEPGELVVVERLATHARPRLRPHRRAAGGGGRSAHRLAARRAQLRSSHGVLAGRPAPGRGRPPGGTGRGPPGSARSAAGHDRRRRRARLRRCRLCDARGCGLAPGGRDRRRRALCAAGRCARPRGARARQLGLFSRPRAADAARGALERPVLAAAGRGSRLPGGASVARCERPGAPPPLRARADALEGAAYLRAGAGGGRRQPRRRHGPADGFGDRAAVRRVRRAARGAARSAARSISRCRRCRSGSTRAAGRSVRAAAPGWIRTV